MRYLFMLPIVLVLLSMSKIGFAAEPPFIPPIEDQTAVVGELFTLDVNAVLANPVETYQLLESRPGMNINSSTGLITWTPASAGDGGRVRVRAFNSAGESVRSFLIYLNEGVICDPDLISYWPLNEASGSVYNDEAGGYDANAVAILTNVTGVVGNGKQFTPGGKTAQGVNVADQGQYDFPRSQGFSVSMWIKYDGEFDGPNGQVLIARGDPSLSNEIMWFNVMVNETDFPGGARITFEARPKSNIDRMIAHGQPYINIGQWYHVVAVYQGSTAPHKINMNVYVNAETTTSPYSYYPPDADFIGDNQYGWNIGYWDRYSTNRYPFNGAMDEITIYDRALSGSEITQIYQKGLSGNQTCMPGNYSPLITSEPVTTVAQDELYSYTVTSHDYDYNSMTLSADIVPSWASFNPGTGVLSGTPGSTDVGNHPVRLLVSDASGSSTQSFTITVTDKNDPPVFTSTPVTTALENTAYSYSFLAVDPDGNNLTYTVGPGLASWLSFNASSKLLVGIPQRTNVGDHAVKITASDGEFSVDQDFVITVASSNHAPVITSSPTTAVNKLSPYSYRITATDADPADALTFSAQVLPSWLTFDPVTQLLSGTPQNIHVGAHAVVLVVSDGYAQTQQDFTVTVNNVNTPPQVLSVAPNTAETGKLYVYFVEVMDYENDPVVLNGIVIPNWMVFDAASRVLTGTPGAANIGVHNVIITVTDGVFLVNHSFTVTVGAVGIEEVSSLVTKVYPNPADEYVTFEFSGSASHIEISDLAGKVLVDRKIGDGARQVQIDVSGLNDGMYMFRVIEGDTHQTGKLIIH
ncbi:MAG: putative Ig domain-containing protein [Bacteroidota bacterium]